IADFKNSLLEAVRSHADVNVPLGASLSGGLDSSTVVCMAPQALRCYSIKYDDGTTDEAAEADEIEFASIVAKHRNAELVAVPVDDAGLEPVAETACWQVDEPFPSLNIIAQWIVFRAASRDGIKVVLTAQGDDELLGG